MISRMSVCVLAIFALVLFGFVVSASAAGGDVGNNGPSLGGSFYPAGWNGYPNYGSNASSYGTTADGNFYINLDGGHDSLQSANWQFNAGNASPGGSTSWTATCYLHGLRNSPSTSYSKNWSSSYTDVSGANVSASLNANSYDQNGWQISSLNDQITADRAWMTANPNAPQVQILIHQLDIMTDQLQIQQLQLTDKQILSISGDMDIGLSTSTGSNFRYWDSTDNIYSYPNGYNNPVVTTVPSWGAEYDFYGSFINGPLPPVYGGASSTDGSTQSVPEPSMWALILTALGGLLMRRWIKR